MKKSVTPKESKESILRRAARAFIETVIVPEMDKVTGTDATCVVKEVPSEAYTDLDAFSRYCALELPEDYNVSISHDGGGVYNTLVVSWA